MTIDRDSLAIGRFLGKGGFGVVYEVITPNGLLPDPTCAYKEFTAVDVDTVTNLPVLVDFRQKLPSADVAALDALMAWPLEVVESRGQVVGYLMRVVPDRFMETSIAQAVGTTGTMRTLDWLARPDHARRSGADLIVDADDLTLRLSFCAQLARALHFLHVRGVVVGDLSQTNAVHSGSPPEIMLIDLDPVRVEGRSPGFRQAHSPGMSPPECRAGQKHQDIFTDRFKMAILFYNILGVQAQVDPQLAGLTGRIDDRGSRMFAAALGGNKQSRPAADAWYRYFYDRVVELSNPPAVDAFEVQPTRAVVGQSVEVSWTVKGNLSLTLETPWGETRHFDFTAPGSLRLPVRRSGQFRLTAANAYGSVQIDSEFVYAFEPPKVRFVDVGDLQGVTECLTGFETEGLVPLGDDFSWVDSNLALGADYSWVDSMLTLSILPDRSHIDTMLREMVGGQAMDTRVLATLVVDAIADAEADVRATANDAIRSRQTFV